MNTTYRKNLKDVAIACKNYTEDKIMDLRWELGANDLSISKNTSSAYQKTAPTDTIAGKINKINGNCIKYAPSTASDNTVAYLKSIPTNTYTINVNNLGGMSYKSENLLVMADEVKTASSVQFTISNGTISSSGTPSSTGWIRINEITLPSGTYSFKDLTSSATNVYLINSSYTQLTTTFTLNATTTVYVAVQGSAINNNGNLNKSLPMLVSGSTAPTVWKQGFTGIRDSAVSQLTIKGNLFDKTNVIARTYINSNGSLGTESQDGWYTTQPIEILNAVTFNFNTVQARWRLLDNSQNYISNTYNSTVNASETITNTVNAKYVQICFRMNDLDTFMVVNGSTAPSVFKPYIAPTTKSIPAQIQTLDGYGWGVNSACYNYIDFDKKVFVQKVGRVDLGTLDYTLQGTGQNVRFRTTISDIKGQESLSTPIVILSSIYTPAAYNDTREDKTIYYDQNPIGTQSIGIKNDTYNDAETFKTAMNGVYLYYELATPIETDISSYLTDFNPITTNDNYASITFDNTYNNEVPSALDFLGMISEVLCTSITANDTTLALSNNDAKYGWSAGSVSNVRDYDINKGTQNVGKYTFTGNETISFLNVGAYPNIFYFTLPVQSVITASNAITDANLVLYTDFNNMLSDNTNSNYICGSTSGTRLLFKLIGITTTSGALEFLKGKTFYYQIATPVVEDITPLTSQFLNVVGGDVITFTNTNNEAVSSEVTFLIEEER